MKRALCISAAAFFLLTITAVASARPAYAERRRQEKQLFNLSVGYYIAAGAICVIIGAAGGVAYAGIMGPKRTRRPHSEPD